MSEDVSDVESKEDGEGAIGCVGGRGGWVSDDGAGVLGWVVGSDEGGGPVRAKVDAWCRAETRLPVALVRDMVLSSRSRMWR